MHICWVQEIRLIHFSGELKYWHMLRLALSSPLSRFRLEHQDLDDGRRLEKEFLGIFKGL